MRQTPKRIAVALLVTAVHAQPLQPVTVPAIVVRSGLIVKISNIPILLCAPIPGKTTKSLFRFQKMVLYQPVNMALP